jgi:protocatechuate 3,4-dioxygenase, beta subunit
MSDPILRPYAPKAYGDHPPFLFPEYKSTTKRAPQQERVAISQTLSELTGPGPVFAETATDDADLTTNAGTGGEAIGSRTIVVGRVLDTNGEPVPNTLIDIWQANACGRYAHWRETAFPAPLDPNFTGAGRCRTDADGNYRFLTIRPGPYPWGNHPNAWRPAHIHFSLLGPALPARLITQMYFVGDPLLLIDPIFNSVPEAARDRLVASYEHSVTEENYALGYRFDIVLNGPLATPPDPHHHEAAHA